MLDNKYRSYLSDDAFHRNYLKNEDEPVGSSFLGHTITNTIVGVGLALGGVLAYRSGAMRQPMEMMIERLGSFRRTQAQDMMQGIRNWTMDDQWKEIRELPLLDRIGETAKQSGRVTSFVDKSLDVHAERIARLASSPFSDNTPALIKTIQNSASTLADYEARVVGANRYNKLAAMQGIMDRRFDQMYNTTTDQQAAMIKRLGYRQATVADAFPHLSEDAQGIIQNMVNKFNNKTIQFDPMKKIIDSDLFVKASAMPGNVQSHEFADLRDTKHLMSDVMNSIAEDFTIPFIKINPIRMFYLNEFTRYADKPTFALFRSADRQPWITHNNGYLGKDMLYDNGRVLDLDQFDTASNTFKEVANNGYLLNAKGKNSPITRLSRNMMNISASAYTRPTTFMGKVWYETASFLDVGFQDEPIKHSLEVGDPASVLTPIINKFWNIFKPYQDVLRVDLEHAYGADSDWLFMKSFKPISEAKSASEFFSQFWASRESAQNVTTASMFFYGFAERLNATLNQVGLGLSTKNLGSAPQILGKLITHRVLPVLGAVEGLKYSNFIFEQMFGDEYEDKLVDGFAKTSLQVASIRDALGITDFAKQMTKLMPGIEFIGELPIPVPTTEGLTPIGIGDIFSLNKSHDELADYYKNGMEPVRRGRYWEFGNTPVTGGKVDYYQPNWFRRITSDYQYTDTLWGSKDEFWANSPFPNITHPLAPIKHFITDPYHWENKHYYDRPYMKTGGINEIENIPLVGGLLNSTVGQLLKPTRDMHVGEWNTSGKYSEYQGMATHAGYLGGGQPSTVLGANGYFDAATPINGKPTDKYVKGPISPMDPIAYVTSSGNIQLMAKPHDTSIDAIDQALTTVGINKSGMAMSVRPSNNETESYFDNINDQELGNPASLNAGLSNLHYNLTEMGGFYGWISTMTTPNLHDDQYKPKILTSTKAFGYNRAFWDMDLGNMGADANEIFRRFLPRDQHKNYVDTIDNQMPTWMPGSDYFTNFQEGDPYVKVKKGEMRLPGQAYEKLFGVDSAAIDEQIRNAPKDVKTLLDRGVIGRGDFYKPIDRYRILADTAPYSNEYREMRAQLGNMGLSKEELAQIKVINKEVTTRKERVRTYDYRFKTANLKDEVVHVTKVIDSNTFLTSEHPDNPIRLAGLHVSIAKDNPIAAEAHDVISKVIREGHRLRISVNADELNQVNADTYRTISAVVRGGAINNLNRQLIKKGLAKEKEKDFTPTGVHARFTEGQIAFGKMWENVVHLDTPFNTKLMQVRSPLESYERREVYGKDWQDWSSPIQDFAIPWYQNWIRKAPLAAITTGAMIGSFFGANRYGRVIGAALGATIAALGTGYVEANEAITGHTWIPERRKAERNIEEYIDTLKYVKDNALYEQFADKALKEEGFDVKQYIKVQQETGNLHKQRVRDLQKLKRTIMVADTASELKAAREQGSMLLGAGDYHDIEVLKKAINKEITGLQGNRHVDPVSPIAAKALNYYSESRKTMYGYESGDPISNILSALPKKERSYLTKFISAPEEERSKILDTVPTYVKRVLQSAWGMDVDPQEKLTDYFQHHELPGPKWMGWDPRSNLDDMRVKVIKHEGLDNSDFDVWPDDERRAAQVKDKLTPRIDYHEKASIVKQKLHDILGVAGLKDLDISVQPTTTHGVDIDVDVLKDRRAEIIQELNSNGYSLLS